MSAISVSEARFREMMQEDKPILADFWAPWCTYCRRIAPAFEQIAREYEDRVHVVKLNIDEESALAQAEKISVIPTLVFYKDGRALSSLVAPESRAAIDAFLRENLAP